MKKPIILLAVLVVLAFAAVLIGPGFVDWDRYKDQVTSRIGSATGLQVAIEGGMDLALLPRPTFKATGVSIGALPGAATQDMARVDALEVQVALMPLLGGDVQVQRVALLKPHLMLEAGPDGGLNWSLAAGGGVPDSLRLDRVNIEDGVLVWRNGPDGREERFEDIDISLTAASLRGPVEMVGSARFRGLPLTIGLSTGRVTGAGALPMGLTLGLQGVEGTLRLAGIVSLENGFQGEISGEAGSLLAVLQQIWPDSRLPASADQPVAFEARAQSTGDTLELTGLAATLGEGVITGTVAVTFADTPRLDMTLAANRVDLDGLVADAAVSEDSVPAALAALLGNGPDIPSDLVATVDMAVDSITLRGALVRQARLQGVIDGGTLSISRLTAQLPGGSDLALAGTLRTQGGEPHFDFDAQAAANDLRGVMAWLGYSVGDVPSARFRRFSGSASVTGRPNDFQVGAFDFVVDGTRATGGLAYVDHGRPGIGLRLNATRINLDAYRPPDAAALVDGDALNRLAAAVAGFDANLDLTVAGLTVDGVTLRDLRLDATVNGGALTIRNAAAGDAAGATVSLSGSAAGLDPVSGMDIVFTADAPDLPRLSRVLGLAGQTPFDRLDTLTVSGRIAGGAETLTLALLADIAGGTAELGGRVAEPWKSPVYDLSLRVRHPDLNSILAALTPDYRPRGPFGALDLFAVIAGTPEALVIDGLQGTIGDTTLAGRFVIDRTRERPSVEAVVRASELAIDPWIAHRARSSARSPRRWSNEAFDLSPLSGFDAMLALTATGLSANGIRLADPALEARLDAGRLDITALSGRLFGGALGVSGSILAGEPRPSVQISLDLVGADLADAMQRAVGSEAMVGLLDFGLDFETEGSSPAELVANMNGSGLFAASDGQIRGIDLAQTASGLGDLTDPLEFLELQRRTLMAGETAFGAFNATFAMADGVATTEDLRLVGEHGVADGRGNFDVSRWQLDLTADFELVGVSDMPGFGLRLIGPPDDPERVLKTADLQAFIARRAADAVSRRYGDGRVSPQSEAPPSPLTETN